MKIYEGEKFSIERVQQTAPDGRTVTRDRIVHPGAVVVLPVLADGRLVLIRNRRFTVEKTLLEVCAGTLEPEEEPSLCARRELQEETGYTAESLRELCAFYSSPGVMTERMHVFVAEGLRAGPQSLDETEQIEVEILSPDEVSAAIRSGAIEDAKSLVTLLFWIRARDLAPGPITAE